MADHMTLILPDTRPSSGLGHLERCRVLAENLRERSRHVSIVEQMLTSVSNCCVHNSARYATELFEKIQSAGFLACIYDTYNLEYYRYTRELLRSQYSGAIREYFLCDTVAQILQIFGENQEAAIIIPNIIDSEMIDELKLMPAQHQASISYGPDFILLNPAFESTSFVDRVARVSALTPTARPTCLISFGFSDVPRNVEILERLCGYESILEGIDCKYRALGSNAHFIADFLNIPDAKVEKIEKCSAEELRVIYDTSDFYFGTIGYSMWERAAMLLPSYVLAISDNQVPYFKVGQNLGIFKGHLDMPSTCSELKLDLIDMIDCCNRVNFDSSGFQRVISEFESKFCFDEEK